MAALMSPGMKPPNASKKHPAEVLNPGRGSSRHQPMLADGPIGIRNRALRTLLYRFGLRKGDKATTRGFHPSATDALARRIDARRQLGSLHPVGR